MTDPVEGGGLACAPTSSALKGQLSIALAEASRDGAMTGKEVIAGMVPDGVDSVQVESSTGAVRADVNSNVYGLKANWPGDVRFFGSADLPSTTAP